MQRQEDLIGFPATVKHLTLNDLKMLFMLKYVFIVRLTRFFCLALGDNCVKTNEGITPVIPVMANKVLSLSP